MQLASRNPACGTGSGVASHVLQGLGRTCLGRLSDLSGEGVHKAAAVHLKEIFLAMQPRVSETCSSSNLGDSASDPRPSTFKTLKFKGVQKEFKGAAPLVLPPPRVLRPPSL